MRAEGRSVCASWVPSPLFVASARRASPPGSGRPEVSEYRGVQTVNTRRTRTDPRPARALQWWLRPPPQPCAGLSAAP